MADTGALPKFEDLEKMDETEIESKYIIDPTKLKIGNYYAQHLSDGSDKFKYLGKYNNQHKYDKPLNLVRYYFIDFDNANYIDSTNEAKIIEVQKHQLPTFNDLYNMRNDEITLIKHYQIKPNHYYAKQGNAYGFTYLGMNKYPEQLTTLTSNYTGQPGTSNEQSPKLNVNEIETTYYDKNPYEFVTAYKNSASKYHKPTNLIEVQRLEQGGKPRKTIRRKSKKRKMRKTRRKSLTQN